MAKHIVKCPKCGLEFDTNKIQAVKVSARRYGHQTCYPEIKELIPLEEPAPANPELEDLKDYINKLFGQSANWPNIMKEIKKFQEENRYSLSGIKKSLIYHYEIQHNDISKANGHLGIVPYIYQNAYNYYLAIFQAQQNSNIIIKQETKEVVIKTPFIKKIKKKLFSLEDED